MAIVYVNGIPRATTDSSPRSYVSNEGFESTTTSLATSGPGIFIERTTSESEIVRGDASLKITTNSECTTNSYIYLALGEFDIVDTQTAMRVGVDFRALSGYQAGYIQVVLHDGTSEIVPTNASMPAGQGKLEGYWTSTASTNYTIRLKVTSTGAGQIFAVAIDSIRIYPPGWEEDASNKSDDTALGANSSILYPTQRAVKTYIDTTVEDLTTSDIPEGSNLYFTDSRAKEASIVNNTTGNQIDQAASIAAMKNYVLSQSVALSTTHVVANEAEMLALSASVGHLAVRQDESKTYILKQAPASTLANWQEITTLSAVVTSVAGKVGSVSLDTDDVTEGTNLYFTSARAQNALASSLDAKADKTFGFRWEIHVAKNGNDTNSTGSPYQPFLTVAAAIAYVQSTFTSGEYVVIYIHPGSYTEAVTITRPRTHLKGIQSSNAIIAQIGSVTIAPTSSPTGVYNDSFSIEGLLLAAPNNASACITAAGTAEFSLHLRNVYLFADDQGQKGFTVTNTAATKPRLYFNDVLINNTLCNAVALELANAVVQLKNTTIYSGTATCMTLAGTASVIGSLCQFETSGTLAVSVGATSFTLGSSVITATGTNASGISISAGGVYTTVQNFYNVAAGTGYAITGATGGVVVHSFNTFAYGTNSKYKNVLTALANSTSMTASS